MTRPKYDNGISCDHFDTDKKTLEGVLGLRDKHIDVVLIGVLLCVVFGAGAASGGQCIFPTVPKQVEFPPGWHGKPIIELSSNEVEPGESVQAWVVSSGLPCPPYSWSVEGNGFELQKSTTWAPFETNKLSAGASACGSGKISVTDLSGSKAAGYIRSTAGQWVVVEYLYGECPSCDWPKGSGDCYCGDSHGCQPQGNPVYIITEGKERWDLWEASCAVGKWSVYPYGRCSNYCNWQGLEWYHVSGTRIRDRVCTGGLATYPPPCGNPTECHDAAGWDKGECAELWCSYGCSLRLGKYSQWRCPN